MCGLSALYEATDDIARLGITTSVDGTKAVLSQTTQDAKERAWMLTHRGFSAWIVVDGQTLPEYLVAVDVSAHRVNCWIPSEEGKVGLFGFPVVELVYNHDFTDILSVLERQWRQGGHLCIYYVGRLRSSWTISLRRGGGIQRGCEGF